MSEPIDLLPVEQCDRDAAEAALFAQRGYAVRLPKNEHYLTQAFARHRLATLSAPIAQSDREPVAWRYDKPDNGKPYAQDSFLSADRRVSAVLEGWTETPLYAGPVKTYADGVEDAARSLETASESLREAGYSESAVAYINAADVIRALKGEP